MNKSDKSFSTKSYNISSINLAFNLKNLIILFTFDNMIYLYFSNIITKARYYQKKVDIQNQYKNTIAIIFYLIHILHIGKFIYINYFI